MTDIICEVLDTTPEAIAEARRARHLADLADAACDLARAYERMETVGGSIARSLVFALARGQTEPPAESPPQAPPEATPEPGAGGGNNQERILALLAEAGPLTAGELRQRLDMPSGSVSGSIDRLLKRGRAVRRDGRIALPDDVEPEPEPEPEPEGPQRRHMQPASVEDLLAERGPMDAAAIAAALALTPQGCGGALNRLSQLGRIERDGDLYRVVTPEPEPDPTPELRALPAGSHGTALDHLVTALQTGPLLPEALATMVSGRVSRSGVQQAIEAALRHGQLVQEPDGRLRATVLPAPEPTRRLTGARLANSTR